MPLDHNAATASIIVTGLSLGCFNPTNNQWEVGFIRACEHKLTMAVLKQTKDAIDLVHAESDFCADAKIHIETAKAITPAKRFYRPGLHELEDFSHVLDIEEELYGGNKVAYKKQVPAQDPVVTPLFVSEPEFYAIHHKRNGLPLKLIKISEPHKPERPFRDISTAVGADIKCAAWRGHHPQNRRGETV